MKMISLLESWCDVLIEYELSVQLSNKYIQNFRYDWNGYLPISMDSYNQFKQELKGNGVDINRSSIKDVMLITRIRLQVPMYSLKHKIEKTGITDVNELANAFGVGTKLIYEALVYYQYIRRLKYKKYYPI